MAISFALYQPDIPQNAGGALRLAACLGRVLHIIEPCGFVWDDRKLQRAGLDYAANAYCVRHQNFADFVKAVPRIVLVYPRQATSYTDFSFAPDDCLLLGSETSGVPDSVQEQCPNRVSIPMMQGMRSLNVLTAASMVLGEALRQTQQWQTQQ